MMLGQLVVYLGEYEVKFHLESRPNVLSGTIKTLEENIREYMCIVGLGGTVPSKIVNPYSINGKLADLTM